jgi:hypothetical protein
MTTTEDDGSSIVHLLLSPTPNDYWILRRIDDAKSRAALNRGGSEGAAHNDTPYEDLIKKRQPYM